MMRTHVPFLILLLTLTLVTATAGAQPASIDAVRADAAQGNYKAALQKITNILGSANEPGASDRYELLMLKAECQLQLKDRLGSAATFKSAAKVAGDVKQLAAAKANALVVERSSAGKYNPPLGSKEEPIDILPIESRKVAMSRLEQDLWSKNARDIDQAMRAESLPPIERVFTAVADAYFLEMAGTGDAARTGPAMRELGSRAFRLMDAEVTRNARAVDQLSQLANSASDYGGWATSARGLLPAERNQLRQRMAYLVKVQAKAREYRETAARMGGDQQKWDSLVATITDVIADADALASQL